MKVKNLVLLAIIFLGVFSSIGFAQYYPYYESSYYHYPSNQAFYYPSTYYTNTQNYPYYYYQPYNYNQQYYNTQYYPYSYYSDVYYYPTSYGYQYSPYGYNYTQYQYQPTSNYYCGSNYYLSHPYYRNDGLDCYYTTNTVTANNNIYGGKYDYYYSNPTPLPSGADFTCEEPSGVEGQTRILGVDPKAVFVCRSGKWAFAGPANDNYITTGSARDKEEFYRLYGYYYENYPSYPSTYYQYQPVNYGYQTYREADYYFDYRENVFLGTTPYGNDTFTIEIRENKYVPETITVKKGTKIRWINLDGPNWPASDPHPSHISYPGTDNSKCGTGKTMFDACKTLDRGEVFEFKFDTTGTWHYHDHLNPGLKGTIVVEV